MKAAIVLLLALAGCVPLTPRDGRPEGRASPPGVYLGGSVGSYVGSTRQ